MLKLNKIYLGDCLERMNLIPDKSISLILCDLPYGCTNCSWDEIIDYKQLWEHYERIIKDNGVICLFARGTFSEDLIASNRKIYKYKYIWLKHNATNFVNAKNMPMGKYEDILIFSKAPIGHASLLRNNRMTYNPQGLVKINKLVKAGKNKFGTIAGNRPSHKPEYIQEYKNYPTDVLSNFPEPPAINKKHPSEKPVDLLEFLIKTYSNVGDVILDNCIGSGASAIAAIKTNRNFIGIEKKAEYWKSADEWVKKELSQTKLPKNNDDSVRDAGSNDK
jgi:site-specific DNA-methyltransferase (adenine-specific)